MRAYSTRATVRALDSPRVWQLAQIFTRDKFIKNKLYLIEDYWKLTTDVIISHKRIPTFLGINRPTFSEIGTLDPSIKSIVPIFLRRISHGLKLSSSSDQGDFSPSCPVDDTPIWRLIPVDVEVVRTRPPFEVLHLFDPRVWRPFPPTWRIPPCITPLFSSTKATQTKQPAKISRETLHLPNQRNQSTNTEETIRDSFTPPGSPLSYTPPGTPPKRTRTFPQITWKEKI